jgi:hypothetical protein
MLRTFLGRSPRGVPFVGNVSNPQDVFDQRGEDIVQDAFLRAAFGIFRCNSGLHNYPCPCLCRNVLDFKFQVCVCLAESLEIIFIVVVRLPIGCGHTVVSNIMFPAQAEKLGVRVYLC